VSLLEVQRLRVAYGAIEAVRDVNMRVEEGEVVALIGANGAGKSTTLATISGIQRPRDGRITFEGRDLRRLKPPQIVAAGLVQVPEGREIFARMTVEENLVMGAWQRRDRASVGAEAAALLDRFPVLARRRRQLAGVLSGGEQQILAIARGLLARPRLLLLDEPSLGLAPQLVDEVFDIVQSVHSAGNTILLVEQNALRALAAADRAYVMESGVTTVTGTGRELMDNPEVRTAYLGV
jgi:branched-chain amino acid transport system ATP-binding protein